MLINHIFFQFHQDVVMEPLQYDIIQKSKDMNPECPHILWDFKSACTFIDNNYPHLSEVFNMETKFPITKCDLFRYVLMHYFDDTAYFDLDFVAVRPISNSRNIFPEADILLSQEWYESYSTGTLHNGCIISRKKKHPFWELMMRKCVENIPQINHKDQVWEMTGTKLLRNMHKLSLDLLHRNNIAILNYDVFCSYIVAERGNTNNMVVMNGMNKPPLDYTFDSYTIKIEYLDTLVSLVPTALFVMIGMKSMWRDEKMI